MRVVKPQNVTPLVTVFDDGRRLHCVISAIFSVSFDGKIAPEVEMWGYLKDVVEGGVVDEGMPKPRGELLAHGSCFAYKPDTRQSFVKIRVGAHEKALAVFGERTYQLSIASSPRPFDEVPITYANAYGGEGHAENPTGKGHSGDALPQVEVTTRLTRARGDAPPLGGFGRLDPTWSLRTSKMGTYDDRWLKTRFPGVAEDFDGSYFMLALPDQRIDGFFTGNEAISAVNMHPRIATLEGKLPGVVARCFVRRKGEDFVDVALRIDSVHLVPSKERAILVCRGTTPTRSDTLADIEHVLCGLEWSERPKSAAHYLQVFARRTDKIDGPMASLDDRPLLPEDALVIPLPKGSLEDDMKVEGLVKQTGMRHTEHELGKMRDHLAAQGLDNSKIPAKMPDIPDTLSDDELKELARTPIDDKDIESRLEAEKARVMTLARQTAEARGKDFDAMQAEAQAGQVGPPPWSRAQERERIEQRLQLLDNAKSDSSGLRAMLADPAFDQKLRELEAFVRDSYRRTAQLQDAAPALQGTAAEAIRMAVSQQLARGEDLREWDLTGANLSGIDFGDVDARGAFMESTNLEGATFAGAKLDYAVLARANLRGVDLRSCTLTHANLSEATLERANLSDVDLAGAFLVRAKLNHATLDGVILDKVDLSQADLNQCSLDRSKAKELMVSHATLRGVSLRDASWIQCSFVESVIEDCDFSGAHMHACCFIDTRTTKTSFRGASFVNLRVGKVEIGSTFDGCDFSDADLRTANFRGASCENADFTRALLENADFSECKLDDSQFQEARAPGARFMAAEIRRCRFDRADLMEALLGGAQMEQASFDDANLYRADLARAGGDKVSMGGANVKRVRTVPKREGDP